MDQDTKERMHNRGGKHQLVLEALDTTWCSESELRKRHMRCIRDQEIDEGKTKKDNGVCRRLRYGMPAATPF